MKYRTFKGKSCFITGATGGIGRHIAMEMAKNECKLFLTSTDAFKLNKLKEELSSLYGKDINIFCAPGDLNNLQDINRLISIAREKSGPIDILVNCVGVFLVKSLAESSLEDFEVSFNLNIRAAFIFCKEFSRDMIESKWGRIINIGSSSAYSGHEKTSLYCASKHALLGFSRALHAELRKQNIRTFCVSPAGVRTEMGKLIEHQNVDTFINPKEVAEYIIFISSLDNEMISEEIRLNRMVVE